MTEREVREILRDVLADLDRRAAKAARKVVLPSMLGVGLALSGGCGDRTVSRDSSPPPATDGQLRVDTGGPWPAYAVPEYMAPEPDIGPVPEYMAPEPDASLADAGVAPDSEVTPPPTPDYMAPMYGAPEPPEEDSGV